MNSITYRRSRSAVIVAVLQAVLLMSAMALAPAQVIAKNAQPAADSGSAVRDLFVKPKEASLQVGESVKLSAWICDVPAEDESPFGQDREPGTADDMCREATDATWSTESGSLRLSDASGAKTKATGTGVTSEASVVAEQDDKRGNSHIDVSAPAEKSQADRPKAESKNAAEPKKADAPKADAPKADKPNAEPKQDEPKANEQRADKKDKPKDKQPGEGTAASKTIGDEPSGSDDGKGNDKDKPTDEQPAEEALAEEFPAEEQPVDDATAEEAPAGEAGIGPAAAPGPVADNCTGPVSFDGPPGIDYSYFWCPGVEVVDGFNFNEPETWEDAGFGECVYVPSPGHSFTLPAAPAGTTYTLLILKPGNNQALIPDGDPDTDPGPVPGTYESPVQQGLSHAIYCYERVEPASKSGTKFDDLDANGSRDAGEPGIAGITIYLLSADGTTVIDSDVTDDDGGYSFGDIAPGSYLVCEGDVSPPWTQSYPDNDACAGVTGASVESGGWAITLASGDEDTGNDFGNWTPGTKSGTKYDDQDASGDLSGGDVGLGGWTIRAYVDADGDGTLSGSETTIADEATTGADGSYALTLDPGDYVVCEVSQAGWTQSGPTNDLCAAIAAAEGLEPGGHALTITSGGEHSGNDFFNSQPEEPEPLLTIDKAVTGLVTTPDGQATVVYDVLVTNAGPITTTYDLYDVPSFGEGATITNIAVSATTPPVDIPDHTPGDLIVNDQSIDPGVTHTYTVTADFEIDTDITTEAANCTIATNETGTGTLNTATVEYVVGTIDDSACAPVPSGGGSGGGGGGGGGGQPQPPTDTLLPTAVEAPIPTSDGILAWASWIILTATLIVLAGWVIRRYRYAEA